MTGVLKKTKASSVKDLVSALEKFMHLLEKQEEDDAVKDLANIKEKLGALTPEEEAFQDSLKELLDCYHGDHELEAYTLRRKKKDDDWSEAEELYLASIEVLNLIERLTKKN